jgi:serine protease
MMLFRLFSIVCALFLLSSCGGIDSTSHLFSFSSDETKSRFFVEYPAESANRESFLGLVNSLDASHYPSVEVMAVTATQSEVNQLSKKFGVLVYPVTKKRISYEQSFPVWGLDRIDQKTLPLDKKYKYPDHSGKGVNAYIIDTGIANHDNFKGRLQEGFSSFDSSVDCHGHGTHVAGTVGSFSYGVAKDVLLYPVKVLNCDGSGTDEEVIKGIEWVIANHKKPAVANMSLGGEAAEVLDKAIAKMVEAGVTVVVAAGNEAQDACKVSPAREKSAITVGSITNRDTLSSFTNIGSCVDIFAPGSNIQSTYLNNKAVMMSGTSMASPHVAGAVALILGASPDLPPVQVEAQLKKISSSGVINGDTKGTVNLVVRIPD